jgi:ribonuclease HI
LFALKHLKDKEETIYIDSKYAFSVLHTFGKISSKGQVLVHEELIQQILESLKLPEEIAIVHVPGHKGVNFETHGNSFANETTKQGALTSEAPVFSLIPHLSAPHVTPSLPLLRKNN